MTIPMIAETKPRAVRFSFLSEATVQNLMFLFTSLLIFAPLVYLLIGSFSSEVLGHPEAYPTLDNWITVYTSPAYITAFLNTIALSAVTSASSLFVGGAMAWIVARTNAPGKDTLALLIVIPLMLSNTITTLSWIALAAPNAGFINAAARALFGVNTIFNIYSFGGIVLVLVTHYASFAFVAMYAALRSIDGSLEEASYMAGAGVFQTGWRMTLPLVWPTIISSALIIFVLAAENFSVPTLLGAPFNFQTLPARIFYDMTVEPSKPTLAAAAGTMLLWIALIGTFWQRRTIARSKNYVTITGKGSRPRITELTKTGKIVCSGGLILFVLIAVVIPYCALLLGSFLSFLTPRLTMKLFTLDNYARLFTADTFIATRNSLIYSVFGGLFMTLFYVLLAYCIKRSYGVSGRLMEYAVIIPTAIPGLVLGLGILWTFVGLPLPIYGTAAILIIAYLSRNIGYGVRQSRVALVQVSDELTEAAQMSGATAMRAFRDVTIPILQPALLALWAMLFMNVFTELGLTILLYNYKTVTLPIALWNDMASGHQTRAFAIAVLQAVIIFVIIFAANWRWGILRNTLDR